MLEGKGMPSNTAANTNHATCVFVEKSKHQTSGVRSFLCVLTIFGISKKFITHCLREALVT